MYERQSIGFGKRMAVMVRTEMLCDQGSLHGFVELLLSEPYRKCFQCAWRAA